MKVSILILLNCVSNNSSVQMFLNIFRDILKQSIVVIYPSPSDHKQGLSLYFISYILFCANHSSPRYFLSCLHIDLELL